MGTSVITAYVWAIIICLVFILIAIIIANLIPNKPGGKDISQRKTWYWICFVLTVGLSFGINMYLASDIKIPSKHDAYVTATAISAGVAAVLYIILGVVLSKGMKRSKIGSWF
ncbi:MAG: hypothetical protein K2F94_05595 [Muribaculaceae bacterium]|nr:hypothetical protein [Muribaculaceae bacterium]MDE6533451.1 hypothetical protein [Muribaculaceae bacterium]